MSKIYEQIGAVCDDNTYSIRYLLAACESKRANKENETATGGEDNGMELADGGMEIDLGF